MQGCIGFPPLPWGNLIKLLGQKIKWKKREGKREEREGNGRRREREVKKKRGNKVEKWEGREGHQVSGKFIHPCNDVDDSGDGRT